MRVGIFGKCLIYGGDSAKFSAEVVLEFIEFWLEGQFGQLCLTTVRCRTRTGFDSDSKMEFGSGLVKIGCTL
ncbi:unnamed protein product, partial [Prunus brigantina]